MQTSYEAYDSVLLKVKRGVGLLASIIHVWICNQKVLPTCFNCPIEGISSMSPQWFLCHEQLMLCVQELEYHIGSCAGNVLFTAALLSSR